MALKHLVDLDLAGNEIQNVVLQNLATAPTGVEGQIFYDTANNAVKVHTGSGFVRIGASADGTTLTESSGVFSVGTIAISNTSGLQTALDAKADASAIPAKPALEDNSGSPELANGITEAEIRSLIGAGTSSLAVGTSSADALAGDTITITTSQASAITANSGKVSMEIGTTGETAMAGDTRTITSSEITAIADNSSKVSDTGTPAILSNGIVPSLNTGISGAEMRTLIGAGTSSFDGVYTSLTSIPSTFAPSAHTHAIDEIDGLEDDLATRLTSSALTGYATETYVGTAISNVIGTAPAALDTLKELADSLNDDADFAGTMTTALAAKLNSSSYTAADVLTKMLTVDGAGSGLDADKLDGQSSAYYRNYTNLTNKPDVPTFVSKDVTGATSGATDLELGYGGYANIQVYDSDGNLVMTDIVQDGSGSASAQLSSGVEFRIVAVGA
jgi:hypothetical protein